MKVVTVITEDGGCAVLMPDVADGVRIERRNGEWYAELELPSGEQTTPEIYPLGKVL